jgi:hypothetical protein
LTLIFLYITHAAVESRIPFIIFADSTINKRVFIHRLELQTSERRVCDEPNQFGDFPPGMLSYQTCDRTIAKAFETHAQLGDLDDSLPPSLYGGLRPDSGDQAIAYHIHPGHG